MKVRQLTQFLLLLTFLGATLALFAREKTRVLVTTDGEIDDECSLVRFLLYTNEWDVEGLVTTSSQYHWQGHKWAGDDWAAPYLAAYAQVYPNLLRHDQAYPSPQYLRERTLLGNVKSCGDMEEQTPGSRLITKVLLDRSDARPVWVQAWGGTNTLARALKTIEEEQPERMAEVAAKLRLYLIWEQDDTYQNYIRPHWGHFNIPTIISDQFIVFFYNWNKFLPAQKQACLSASWMRPQILEDHGALCSLYKAHVTGEKGFEPGDFRSEGDSPAFLHLIPTGLRSEQSPDWGGWGGRFVRVRDNTWLDPVREPGYQYPTGKWFTESAWGRVRMRRDIPNDQALIDYLDPQLRWLEALQNDFAARADWCVQPYEKANHPPVVVLSHPSDLRAHPGETVALGAHGTRDPDGNALAYRWWHYKDAGSFPGPIEIGTPHALSSTLQIPSSAQPGQTLHVICEVSDNGSPSLTRYQRVVITIAP